MRISDWSSDVCSSDLQLSFLLALAVALLGFQHFLVLDRLRLDELPRDRATLPLVAVEQRLRLRSFEQDLAQLGRDVPGVRSEEHTSELQSLMRISYAVFCLKKKNK